MFPFWKNCFVCLLCLIAISSFSGGVRAADSFVLHFYKHDYTVTPKLIEGTGFSYDQVKPYADFVFLDSKIRKRAPYDLLVLSRELVHIYHEVYKVWVGDLADKLAQYETDRGAEDIEAELFRVFRDGGWKKISDRYKKQDFVIPYQALSVQEAYLRYIGVLYVYNMILDSPEGQAAVEAQKAREAK